MTRAGEWYRRWVERHAETFGLREDGDLAAVLAWEEALAATDAELHAATDWLAANPGAFGATEARYAGRLAMHLGALQHALREGRAVLYRRELSEAQEQGVCVRCGGTGRVVVPHVAGVQDGEWVPMKIARGGASYYTMAVWCNCRLGRWLEGQHHPQRWGDMLNLEQYTRRNPRWEIQMAKRQQAQQARAALGGASPNLQTTLRNLAWQFNVNLDQVRWLQEQETVAEQYRFAGEGSP